MKRFLFYDWPWALQSPPALRRKELRVDAYGKRRPHNRTAVRRKPQSRPAFAKNLPARVQAYTFGYDRRSNCCPARQHKRNADDGLATDIRKRSNDLYRFRTPASNWETAGIDFADGGAPCRIETNKIKEKFHCECRPIQKKT
jgi:hypothetical protein